MLYGQYKGFLCFHGAPVDEIGQIWRQNRQKWDWCFKNHTVTRLKTAYVHQNDNLLIDKFDLTISKHIPNILFVYMGLQGMK